MRKWLNNPRVVQSPTSLFRMTKMASLMKSDWSMTARNTFWVCHLKTFTPQASSLGATWSFILSNIRHALGECRLKLRLSRVKLCQQSLQSINSKELSIWDKSLRSFCFLNLLLSQYASLTSRSTIQWKHLTWLQQQTWFWIKLSRLITKLDSLKSCMPQISD